MEHKFYYKKFDKRSKRITIVVIFLELALVALSYFTPEWVFFPVWFLILSLGVLAMCALSIPRFIRLDNKTLEIHCTVELTRINIEDVEIIRRLDPDEARGLIPIVASNGFFGYFGYFFSLREWNMYKVYTTQRVNLLLIEDIYEDSYIVNCDNPDSLIALTMEARNKKREEIFHHIA